MKIWIKEEEEENDDDDDDDDRFKTCTRFFLSSGRQIGMLTLLSDFNMDLDSIFSYRIMFKFSVYPMKNSPINRHVPYSPYFSLRLGYSPWVDDLVIAGNDASHVQSIRLSLQHQFEIAHYSCRLDQWSDNLFTPVEPQQKLDNCTASGSLLSIYSLLVIVHVFLLLYRAQMWTDLLLCYLIYPILSTPQIIWCLHFLLPFPPILCILQCCLGCWLGDWS